MTIFLKIHLVCCKNMGAYHYEGQRSIRIITY